MARKEWGWIGVDLDGTLAHYDPEVGVAGIGSPIPAMAERVRGWLKQREDVRIFTARASDPTLKAEVEAWALEQFGQPLAVTAAKDFQMRILFDDRCRQVEHNTGRLVGYDSE